MDKGFASVILDIPLMDHVNVSEDKYYSFYDEMIKKKDENNKAAK